MIRIVVDDDAAGETHALRLELVDEDDGKVKQALRVAESTSDWTLLCQIGITDD
jgi:hypothetical protein